MRLSRRSLCRLVVSLVGLDARDALDAIMHEGPWKMLHIATSWASELMAAMRSRHCFRRPRFCWKRSQHECIHHLQPDFAALQKAKWVLSRCRILSQSCTIVLEPQNSNRHACTCVIMWIDMYAHAPAGLGRTCVDWVDAMGSVQSALVSNEK